MSLSKRELEKRIEREQIVNKWWNGLTLEEKEEVMWKMLLAELLQKIQGEEL